VTSSRAQVAWSAHRRMLIRRSGNRPRQVAQCRWSRRPGPPAGTSQFSRS